jgi:RimJ/RimL family protein N-acetyltransferase
MNIPILTITTNRLELIAATAPMVHAEMYHRLQFAQILHARVPGSWPPELNSEATMAFSLRQLEQSPDENGWWVWYFVLCYGNAQSRVLIGNGGFKGRPAPDGTVQIGYSMMPLFQKSGYATEAVAGLVDWAFAHAEVVRIVAETVPELYPSIRVLEKNGFVPIGNGSEDGIMRFELTRQAYEAGRKEIDQL